MKSFLIKNKVSLGVLTSLLLIQPSFSVMANNDYRIEKLAEQLDKVRISGYLNVTAGRAKNDVKFAYDKDLSTTAGTIGGIQLDFQVSDELKMTVLTKFFSGQEDVDEELFGVDLAYATYQLADRTQVKAGILRVPLYKDSDYKDTGFAHLWLAPPELVYDSNKRVQRHTGLELVHDIDFGDGILQLQAFYGQNDARRAQTAYNNICESVGNGKCDKRFKIDDIFGLHAGYSIDDHFFKLGVMTRSEPGEAEDFTTYTPELVISDGNGNTVIQEEKYNITDKGYIAGTQQTFISLGYGYDDGEWKLDTESIIQLQGGPRQDLAKIFGSVGRRFDLFTPYLMYTFEKTIDNDKRGRGLNPYQHPDGSTQEFFNFEKYDSYMLSAGVRYDINSSMALKAQVDKYEDKRVGLPKIKNNGDIVPAAITRKDNMLYRVSLQMVF